MTKSDLVKRFTNVSRGEISQTLAAEQTSSNETSKLQPSRNKLNFHVQENNVHQMGSAVLCLHVQDDDGDLKNAIL